MSIGVNVRCAVCKWGSGYLAVAFAVGVVDLPEESGSGRRRLTADFEVGRDRVPFQKSLWRATPFEARKHADTRHMTRIRPILQYIKIIIF